MRRHPERFGLRWTEVRTVFNVGGPDFTVQKKKIVKRRLVSDWEVEDE